MQRLVPRSHSGERFSDEPLCTLIKLGFFPLQAEKLGPAVEAKTACFSCFVKKVTTQSVAHELVMYEHNGQKIVTLKSLLLNAFNCTEKRAWRHIHKLLNNAPAEKLEEIKRIVGEKVQLP